MTEYLTSIPTLINYVTSILSICTTPNPLDKYNLNDTMFMYASVVSKLNPQ
jgi:hypothetical protein